jgi:hypothetical protein
MTNNTDNHNDSINDSINYPKYYSNYDKNIKAIGGSGVITPRNPPLMNKTTYSINNSFRKNILPVPPMFKTKYYSEPNLTNGYLNADNYIEYDSNIKNSQSDYYYPSQKIDNIKILDGTPDIELKNFLNHSNPLEFPPPLIESDNIIHESPVIYPKKIKKIKKSKNLKKNKKSKSNSSNELYFPDISTISDIPSQLNLPKTNLSKENLQFIKFIENNSLYDGKYIYTIETNTQNNSNNTKINDIMWFPYTNIHDKIKFLDSKQDDWTITNYLEKFQNDFSTSESNISTNIKSLFDIKSISNVTLLVIFSVLLIIYFSKQK